LHEDEPDERAQNNRWGKPFVPSFLRGFQGGRAERNTLSKKQRVDRGAVKR